MDSIFMQNIDNSIEIIVVDDGSPDNSMEIVNDYVAKINNLQIIHQENQGLSGARNTGLKYAKGDYVWFVDSDDSILPNVFPYLLKLLYEYDCDIFGFDVVSHNEYSNKFGLIKCVNSNRHELYGKVINRRQVVHNAMTALVQMFIFKRSFLVDNGLYFHKGIIHEDVELMGKAYFFANRILFQEQHIYNYLIRENGSIMSSLNMRSLEDRDSIIKCFGVFREQHVHSLSDKAFIDDYLLKILMLMLDFNNETIESEIYKFFKNRSNSYRLVAFRGLLANIYFLSVKKIMRAFMIMASPAIYHKFRTRIKK